MTHLNWINFTSTASSDDWVFEDIQIREDKINDYLAVENTIESLDILNLGLSEGWIVRT